MSTSDLLCELVESFRRDSVPWDVLEDGSRDDAMRSAAGRFSSTCAKMIDSKSMRLTVCFSAYRSILSWFKYCDDVRPLRLMEYAIDCILDETGAVFRSEAFDPVIPYDGDERIVDCRLTDTLSASSSVAYACRYLASGDIFDFIVSISFAHVAFEVSPIHRSDMYESWLCKIAVPVAMEHRKMRFDETFAFSDYYFDANGKINAKP